MLTNKQLFELSGIAEPDFYTIYNSIKEYIDSIARYDLDNNETTKTAVSREIRKAARTQKSYNNLVFVWYGNRCYIIDMEV